MHKASRVPRRRRPPLPKERKTGDKPYPSVNLPPQQKTAVDSPKARKTAVTRRSGPDHAEVPPMKEQPEVGGRKPDPEPRKIEEDREVFQLPESTVNWRPTEGPRTPELDLGTTSGRAMTTRSSVRKCPNATAGWQTRHGSDKEEQAQDTAVEAAPKWLNLHQKPQGTA